MIVAIIDVLCAPAGVVSCPTPGSIVAILMLRESSLRCYPPTKQDSQGWSSAGEELASLFPLPLICKTLLDSACLRSASSSSLTTPEV